MTLFLFSIIILAYIVSRYSRYRSIVLETQMKLLTLSRDVSSNGILHGRKETIDELLRLIDTVIYNVPNTNFYVTLYLLKTKSYRNKVRREFDKNYDKYSSDALFVHYMNKIHRIIIEHQVQFHTIEMRLLSINISKLNIEKFEGETKIKRKVRKRKRRKIQKKRSSINTALHTASQNSIPGVMAYELELA